MSFASCLVKTFAMNLSLFNARFKGYISLGLIVDKKKAYNRSYKPFDLKIIEKIAYFCKLAIIPIIDSPIELG
jgi:hypothetical protein